MLFPPFFKIPLKNSQSGGSSGSSYTEDEIASLNRLKRKYQKFEDDIIAESLNKNDNNLLLYDDRVTHVYLGNDEDGNDILYFDEEHTKPIAKVERVPDHQGEYSSTCYGWRLLKYVDTVGKNPSETENEIPEDFIKSGNVFEVHILKYLDENISQEKIDKFINFMKQDKLNLFTELIKHQSKLGISVADEFTSGFTDKLDNIPRFKLIAFMKDAEDVVFKSRESVKFWKVIFDEYIKDVVPILQFRLVGTYWTDLAIEGSSQYKYYRDLQVKGAFEIDMAKYNDVRKYILERLDFISYSGAEDSYVNIGTKGNSRNLKDPKKRPFVDLGYEPTNIILQPMKMIIIQKLINFYKYMASLKAGTQFTTYFNYIKGFNFSYGVSLDTNKTQVLPPEEGDLKAIYDKWFNRENPNLRYPDYYGINYLKEYILVKQFNTEEELEKWEKLP